jgi:hypothetical protein
LDNSVLDGGTASPGRPCGCKWLHHANLGERELGKVEYGGEMPRGCWIDRRASRGAFVFGIHNESPGISSLCPLTAFELIGMIDEISERSDHHRQFAET